MGFYTTLYVGKIESFQMNDKFAPFLPYMETYAMVELWSIFGFSSVGDLTSTTKCYLLAQDGNTHITRDRYDEPLKAIPFQDFIIALRKDVAKEKYRRTLWALSLLESIDQNINDTKDLYVVLFNH